ncbi:hypothetical protein A10D4_12308 [Idiomarina xiamenensis 10-D-4]|uniref:Uncharacterized protein n=1 Tax=Idiomarina xiamenensis 10-D-4 TaxID=740709 RepID=K2KAL8_9GAMM|nr:hypothetical protein A10D4_12308 [Idiomarina xiamenensis 10-D-4]
MIPSFLAKSRRLKCVGQAASDTERRSRDARISVMNDIRQQLAAGKNLNDYCNIKVKHAIDDSFQRPVTRGFL